jgi:hypothetical protein
MRANGTQKYVTEIAFKSIQHNNVKRIISKEVTPQYEFAVTFKFTAE